ncbi:putative btb poz domain containing protein [Botrytis fragariae]|uniref:Putative btb poz domain containing protein n=1 Tax=Botrytis fragariae TaxID=1964551 RepID=A0A8H6AIZ1_9HELO|nr:putative btb poz domain containing protein [Botrytis fragariae]KAF5868242.1 putative btb poz domain containing protein [Botrytis fragariae]
MFSFFYSRGASGKKAGSYACETCDIQCKTNYHLEQHNLGKQHLAKVKAAETLESTAKTAQQPGPRMTVIVVGKARKRYQISHDILYDTSPYFRELCDNCAESVQESSFRIEEECEQFGIFIYCLKNQDLNIPTPIGVVPALLELYFVAAKYQVSFLQDRIIDHLLIMKRCLQAWDIKRLYEKTDATSKLRWLCACDTTFLLRSSTKEVPASQDSIEHNLLRAAEECPEFTFDVFRVQLIYNTCSWPGTYMHDFHACEFHCHEADKLCHHINFDGLPRLPGSFVDARNLDGALRDSSNGGSWGKDDTIEMALRAASRNQLEERSKRALLKTRSPTYYRKREHRVSSSMMGSKYQSPVSVRRLTGNNCFLSKIVSAERELCQKRIATSYWIYKDDWISFTILWKKTGEERKRQ